MTLHFSQLHFEVTQNLFTQKQELMMKRSSDRLVSVFVNLSRKVLWIKIGISNASFCGSGFQSGNYICPEEMLKSETGQKGYSSLAISILSSHWWLAVTTPIRWMILSIFSLIQPFLSCGLEKHLVATAAQRQKLTKIFANLRYFETSSCGTCSSMPRFVEMFYHKRPALMAKKNIRQSLNQIRRFSAVAISPVHIRCAKALATSNLSTSF